MREADEGCVRRHEAAAPTGLFEAEQAAPADRIAGDEPSHRPRGCVAEETCALIVDVVASARTAGLARVEVTGNLHARAFYESVGFVGGETVATRWDPALRMRLDVKTAPDA